MCCLRVWGLTLLSCTGNGVLLPCAWLAGWTSEIPIQYRSTSFAACLPQGGEAQEGSSCSSCRLHPAWRCRPGRYWPGPNHGSPPAAPAAADAAAALAAAGGAAGTGSHAEGCQDGCCWRQLTGVMGSTVGGSLCRVRVLCQPAWLQPAACQPPAF